MTINLKSRDVFLIVKNIRLLRLYIYHYAKKNSFSIVSAIVHLFNLIDLCLQGVNYGSNLSTSGRLNFDIYPKSKVTIGNNVSFISSSKRCTASSLFSKVKFKTFTETSNIFIGNNVGLNGTSITSRSQKIKIGDNTKIGGNVIIVDSDFHNPWPPHSRHIFPGPQSDEGVNIGQNCWVGMNCIILKGVSIGNNSIIGAGSLVLNEIPPNCLAAGVPAKVIKYYPAIDY